MKRNLLSAAQVLYISEELKQLENFLYAFGLSPRQVQVSRLYLQSDLTALFLLGIQVVEVDRTCFLALLEGRSK